VGNFWGMLLSKYIHEQYNRKRMDNLIEQVKDWGTSKNLLPATDEIMVQAQWDKLQEEVYELCDEIMRKDYSKSRMELGDVLVVCTLLAYQLGATPQECLGMAYEKISKRTGKTIDGQFVKDKEV